MLEAIKRKRASLEYLADKEIVNGSLVNDMDWLIAQAEKVEQQRTELIERKKYEGFLRSIIRTGKNLKDEQDFNWFIGNQIN